jgi:hypothetical protein
MKDEPEEYPNDPIDDELDSAMIAAQDLVAHARRAGAPALELPIVDDSGVWVVTVKRLGILEDA